MKVMVSERKKKLKRSITRYCKKSIVWKKEKYKWSLVKKYCERKKKVKKEKKHKSMKEWKSTFSIMVKQVNVSKDKIGEEKKKE